jgi:hypothetical protein
MTDAGDEPRTKQEKQADFVIGILVGCFLAFMTFCRGLPGSMEKASDWFMCGLPILFVLGCGFVNYHLGARLWSRQ